MKIDVVIVHYNHPRALIKTCLAFKERRDPRVQFILIDNSSKWHLRIAAKLVVRALTSRSRLVVRPNKNREAGAYWHYILSQDSFPDLVVFTQEELHQNGVRPKMVPLAQYGAGELPFYPEHFGIGGLSLEKCWRWIRENPSDLIGFGGRRCRVSVEFDKRFTTRHWRSRWAHLDLQYFDYFSGACFAVGPKLIQEYKALGTPTDADLTDPAFAWMWERIWGTIPLAVGGNLVHCSTGQSNRIDAYVPDPNMSLAEFHHTIPQIFSGSLSVRRAPSEL